MSENTIIRLIGDLLMLDSEGHVLGMQQIPAIKQSIKVAEQSIAPGATVNINLAPAVIQNIKSAVITIQAGPYDPLASGGIEADLYASGDAVVYDSVPFIADLEPPFAAGTTKQISFPINMGIYAGRLVIQNLDLTNGVPIKVFISF